MHVPIRHGRQATPSALGLLLRAFGVVSAVLLISAAAVVAIAISTVTAPLADSAVDIGGTPPPPPPLLGAVEGGFDLLVVGTDNDRDQGDDYGERDATLNDVTILLHVAEDHQSAVVVSFPRDLVIAHPECVDQETGDEYDAMSASPLNVAWQRGGLPCVVQTIDALTGLDIPYALATSFNGVRAMTDAVGGVEVCLESPMLDADSGLDLPAGPSLVQGQTALSFLRNRHAVGDGSDLSRISSQQQYLSSLLRRIRSESTLTDPARLYGLARAVSENTIPSTSLGGVDSLISLALALKEADLSRVVFVQ